MKFTEGAFKEWGYSVARNEFRDRVVTERESWIIGNADSNKDLSYEDNAKMLEPGYDMMTDEQQATLRKEVQGVIEGLYPTHGKGAWKNKLLIKDAIADIALQQVLTRPNEFDVIATMNLNGDYLVSCLLPACKHIVFFCSELLQSDALAAQVGGIGIAPGANINYTTGHAIFEATHGTAPKYANLDKVGKRDSIPFICPLTPFSGQPRFSNSLRRNDAPASWLA